MFMPNPDLDFYPSQIPDPGVKKAPDPGSATLPIWEYNTSYFVVVLGYIYVQGAIPAISYSSSDDDDEDFFDAEVRYNTSYF